jgi:GT2 family glycosyltransferase/glycosyltransferase involved in cell wall biosynthesis
VWSLEFEEECAPEVSVVVCAHDHVDMTLACLEALRVTQRWNVTPFEVLLVDDASGDATTDLRSVPGVVYVRLDENMGFLRAANAGVAAARGRHVLFLNNDTLPQGSWLDEMTDTLHRRPKAGVIGARLIFPDGRLQEAGGLIFRDASGWNYGRLGDPEDPRVTFERPVDYCSGAAMLVRGELLRSLGGFDERFAPAYYEDTDLCFAAREHGWEVWYQPDAIVVHVEGASHGVDERTGIKAYQGVNREKFRRKWAHALAAQGPPDAGAVPVGRRRTGRGHVVVVDHEVPTPDRDSGSVRLTAILRGLIDLGYAVTFLPHNGWRRPPYTHQLERLGVEVLGGPETHWDIVREMAAGVTHAWVARPPIAHSMLLRLRADLPHVRVIYDTVDLHFLRELREAGLKGTAELIASAAETRSFELTTADHADAVVVVSSFERDLLSTLTSTPVHVIPNVHEVGPERTHAPASDELMFVGGFRHPPNEDAVDWFVADVLPRVRRSVPSARLVIAGSHMTDRVRALQSEAVEVIGWVPRLEPLYACVRAVVAPLRYGAGLKGKVGEALSLGVPTAMTAIAAEGMHIDDGVHALVADQPAELADRIVRLMRDDDLWFQLSRSGQKLIEQRFSPEAVRPLLDRLLDGGSGPERTPLPAHAP